MFTKYCKQEKVKKCKTLIYQICFCKVSFVMKTSWFVFVKSCHFITKSLLQLISAAKSKSCHIVVVCGQYELLRAVHHRANQVDTKYAPHDAMNHTDYIDDYGQTLWLLLVGFSSCSHIPQGKEQVIVKSSSIILYPK